MPQWLTTCSRSLRCKMHINTYVCAGTHIFPILLPFHFLPTKIRSCILMRNCIYVGCGDKNLPADRNAWQSVFTYTRVTPVHTYPESNTENTNSQIFTHGGCEEERKRAFLSIHHCVKLPAVMTLFSILCHFTFD